MLRRFCLLLATLATGCLQQSVTLYPVGGTVSGLDGVLTIQNNSLDILKVSANGSYQFGNLVEQGLSYSVAVLIQPAGQTCKVSNPTGTVGSGAVTTVNIACADAPGAKFNLGGLVNGLATGSGAVTLKDSVSGETVAVAGNGSFNFPTKLNDEASYQVSVQTQPGGLYCTVSNGSGTVLDADVTNISVLCSGADTLSYPVGGTLVNLPSGTTLTLQNNGQENLALSANGNFTFSTTLSSTQTYNVTVLTQPDAQHTCAVQNGVGTMGTAPVTNVVVTCGPGVYTVSGDVTGLVSQSIEVQLSGDETVSVTGDGTPSDTVPFSFQTPLGSGDPYTVALPSTPGVSCSFSGGASTVGGSVGNSNVVVHITCSLSLYAIGGTVANLPNSQDIVLENNSGDDLTLVGNGNAAVPFMFASSVPSGSSYSITVSQPPPGLACEVANGTGSVTDANIVNVQVSCAQGYTIGGVVNGGAQGEGIDLLLLSADGNSELPSLTLSYSSQPFTFSRLLQAGRNYSVVVNNPPQGQQCSTVNASGTTAAADVTNVVINCTTPVATNQGGSATAVIGQANFSNATFGGTSQTSLLAPMGNPIVLSSGATYVPDTGSSRVLVFNTLPTAPNPQASFVMGQPNFTSHGNSTSQSTFNSPQSVASDGNVFAVADTLNSRILGYTAPPLAVSPDSPNAVLGQPNFNNAGAACGANFYSNPNSVFMGGNWMLVPDTGNNRVLIYSLVPNGNNLMPVTGQAPHLVLGDNGAATCTGNMTSPTDAWTDGERVIVVSAGAQSVFIWNTFPTQNGQMPDITLGGSQGQTSNQFNNPTHVTSNGVQIFVADTGNNRVCVFNQFPTNSFVSADWTLGSGLAASTACQPAAANTLCGPQGVAVSNGQLIVSDTQNNRALIF